MRSIPDYGDHMPLSEFEKDCIAKRFINYDGTGYYATDTKYSDKEIFPSDVVKGKIDRSFSHVIWFNR